MFEKRPKLSFFILGMFFGALCGGILVYYNSVITNENKISVNLIPQIVKQVIGVINNKSENTSDSLKSNINISQNLTTVDSSYTVTSNSLTEYVNPTEMPSLIGTNSFFIVDDTIPTFANGIINLNALPYGTTRVGSIIGGINSDLPHVSNTPNFSYASGFVMRVYLTKIIDTHTPETEVKNNILNLIAYPNPASKNITIQFETSKPEPVTIVILNQAGQQIDTYQLPKNEKGFYRFNYEPVKAGLYYSKVITSSYTKTVTFLVK